MDASSRRDSCSSQGCFNMNDLSSHELSVSVRTKYVQCCLQTEAVSSLAREASHAIMPVPTYRLAVEAIELLAWAQQLQSCSGNVCSTRTTRGTGRKTLQPFPARDQKSLGARDTNLQTPEINISRNPRKESLLAPEIQRRV